MKKGDSRKKTGFTIIEVALVLAIAGLIFLMVFVAVPQLQRQQRDAKRREDILAFIEAIKKYQANNRGQLPPLNTMEWQNVVIKEYIGDNFSDPDGTVYGQRFPSCSSSAVGDTCSGYEEIESMDHNLHIYYKAVCDGSQPVKSSNPRNIAVVYRLEGAGEYCANT